MLRDLRVRAAAVALGVLLVGCGAGDPEVVVSPAATEAPVTATPTPTLTPTPSAPSTPTAPPTAPAEPVVPAPEPAPAPPPPPPAEPTEEVLSPDEAETILIDTVSAELGVPRFIVSRYISANGGLEAVARENSVSEDDIARLNAGVTRSELDAALGPLVDQIEQRLSEG